MLGRTGTPGPRAEGNGFCHNFPMGVQAGVPLWGSLIPGASLTFRFAAFREETLGPEDCPSVCFPVIWLSRRNHTLLRLEGYGAESPVIPLTY